MGNILQAYGVSSVGSHQLLEPHCSISDSGHFAGLFSPSSTRLRVSWACSHPVTSVCREPDERSCTGFSPAEVISTSPLPTASTGFPYASHRRNPWPPRRSSPGFLDGLPASGLLGSSLAGCSSYSPPASSTGAQPLDSPHTHQTFQPLDRFGGRPPAASLTNSTFAWGRSGPFSPIPHPGGTATLPTSWPVKEAARFPPEGLH